MEDYRVLNIAAIVFRVIGWVALAYGILAAFMGLFNLELDDGSTPALRIGLNNAVQGLLILSAGEAIRLLLNLNERSQVQERRYRQLDREREHAARLERQNV